MAQKVTGYIKLQIPAGKATPAPPVGPALGQHGVNIMSFTKEFNERTQKDIGYIIPVVITVYADRSFSFITKTPPAPVLIKKELGLESASGVPNKTKVGQLTKEQVKKIAEMKMIYELSGEKPVLLLDDVMSELDQRRRAGLINEIASYQTFITCTDRETISSFHQKIFEVHHRDGKGTVQLIETDPESEKSERASHETLMEDPLFL